MVASKTPIWSGSYDVLFVFLHYLYRKARGSIRAKRDDLIVEVLSWGDICWKSFPIPALDSRWPGIIANSHSIPLFVIKCH